MRYVLHHLRAQPAGPVRATTWQGRPHLVAPVVALQVGVWNGVLMDAVTLSASAPEWNGMPVVVGHPKDASGEPISVHSSPEVAEHQIGRLWAAQVTEGQLRAEVWLDVEVARRQSDGARLALSRLEALEPLEVSTGFFASLSPDSGLLEGREYAGSYREVRPDHLALLPEGIGACSWADGCGMPRTHEALAPDTPDIEGESMDKQPLVATILTRLGLRGDGVRQAVEAMPEAPLAVFAGLCAQGTDQAPGPPPAPPAPEPDPEPAPEEPPSTVAGVLARLGVAGHSPLSQTVQAALEAYEAERARLLADLQAAQCPVSAAELARAPLDLLKACALMMRLPQSHTVQPNRAPATFEGQGGTGMSQTPEADAWAPVSLVAHAQRQHTTG